MGRVTIPTWPGRTQASIHPLSIMRNGVRPSGPQVSGFPVGLLNHCLGYRLRRHFSKSVYPAQLVNNGGGVGAITTWRWFMRTLPNETTLKVRAVLGPSDSDTPEGNASFHVRIIKHGTGTTVYDDGTSGTDKRSFYGTAIATPTSATLNDIVVREVEYTVEADTEYRCEVRVDCSASVLSLSAYGMVRTNLDTATADTVVDPGKFLINEAIDTTNNLDFLASAETLWKRHGAAHIAWSVDGITAKTVTGTSETNLIDGVSLSWTSTTRGFQVHTTNRHSLDTTLGASPTYLAPVQCWAYASVSGGGTGTVRFRWGTGGSDFLVVSGITSGTPSFILGAAQGIPGNADQKVDITALCSTGGTTVSVYAAGFYDYSA